MTGVSIYPAAIVQLQIYQISMTKLCSVHTPTGQ